jgi:membrane dipeptidase
MLPVFDGHNDVITRDDAGDFATGRSGGHIDLPRARAGGLAGGIFALFTPSPGEDVHLPQDGGSYAVELAEPIGQEPAAADTTRAAGRLFALERAGHLRIARRAGDLDAALADGVLAAVLHMEGAEAIDPGL